MNMEAIFTIMNTTLSVVKVWPEKNSGLCGLECCTGIAEAMVSRVQIPYRPEFFLQALFSLLLK